MQQAGEQRDGDTHRLRRREAIAQPIIEKREGQQMSRDVYSEWTRGDTSFRGCTIPVHEGISILSSVPGGAEVGGRGGSGQLPSELGDVMERPGKGLDAAMGDEGLLPLSQRGAGGRGAHEGIQDLGGHDQKTQGRIR